MAFMSKNEFTIFNFFVLCLILIGLASALAQIRITFAPPPKKLAQVVEPSPEPLLSYVPQFVLISFDGSRDVELWKDLRDFKERLNREGKRLNFTFFINTAYFLTKDTRNFYLPPRSAPGQTTIGIASGIEDVRSRINEVNVAFASGDEIAVHTTGHHSGLTWSKDEWGTELASFDAILFGLDKLYPDAQLPPLSLKLENVIGFRAPYLDKSPGLYEMLHANPRYRYDTSEFAEGNNWPKKDAAGLWRIPLGTLFVGPRQIRVLAMDYNLYVRDTNAVDWMKKGTEAWQKAHDETLAAWLQYFDRNYTKGRAPVLMGYHFGQWNDGLYWEVMKEFAHEVCGKPEVHCGTFKELVDYMDEYGVPKTE